MVPEKSTPRLKEPSSDHESCRACGGPVLSPADGVATWRCEGCLVTVYCSQECQESHSSKHEDECAIRALVGFTQKLESLTGMSALCVEASI